MDTNTDYRTKLIQKPYNVLDIITQRHKHQPQVHKITNETYQHSQVKCNAYRKRYDNKFRNNNSDGTLKKFAWHRGSFGLFKRFAEKLNNSRLVCLMIDNFFLCLLKFFFSNPCKISLESLIFSF